jgi:hypothetical protein
VRGRRIKPDAPPNEEELEALRTDLSCLKQCTPHAAAPPLTPLPPHARCLHHVPPPCAARP